MYFSIVFSVLIAIACGSPVWFQDDISPRRVDELQLRKEFSFMVGLVFDGVACSGSLISENFILTAAHCLDQQLEVKAFFGVHSWSRYSHPRATFEQTINSDNFIIHPSFEYEDYLNDIALIQLSEPIILTDRIRVIRLPQQNLIANESNVFISSSWGITERAPTVIPLLYFMITELTQCPSFVPVQKLNQTPSIVCSIETPYKHIFHQDGGDPLVLISDTNDSHTIVGVTSVGGTEYGDKVFTNVFYYLPWIHEVIGSDEQSKETLLDDDDDEDHYYENDNDDDNDDDDDYDDEDEDGDDDGDDDGEDGDDNVDDNEYDDDNDENDYDDDDNDDDYNDYADNDDDDDGDDDDVDDDNDDDQVIFHGRTARSYPNFVASGSNKQIYQRHATF